MNPQWIPHNDDAMPCPPSLPVVACAADGSEIAALGSAIEWTRPEPVDDPDDTCRIVAWRPATADDLARVLAAAGGMVPLSIAA